MRAEEDSVLGVLDDLERNALTSLVRQAAEGNASAAASALGAVERLRKTRQAEIHRTRMEELRERPAEFCGYLASLGQTVAQVEARLGRKMKAAELAAYERATDDRLLEVRAVELGRMRRGDGDVPRWANKRGT